MSYEDRKIEIWPVSVGRWRWLVVEWNGKAWSRVDMGNAETSYQVATERALAALTGDEAPATPVATEGPREPVPWPPPKGFDPNDPVLIAEAARRLAAPPPVCAVATRLCDVTDLDAVVAQAFEPHLWSDADPLTRQTMREDARVVLGAIDHHLNAHAGNPRTPSSSRETR